MWLIFDVDKVYEYDEFIVVLIFFASRVEVYSYFNNFEIYLFPQLVKIQTYPISSFLLNFSYYIGHIYLFRVCF